MKTKSMLAAAALCLLMPAAAGAQGLPDFLSTVGDGIGEGVAQSAAKIAASMEAELELALSADSTRIEEGQTLTLTVAAKNPRTEDTQVTFALALPERLSCGQEAAWEAVLPAATADENGEIVPSVTTFTRTLTLVPGGASESAEIVCEMSMGTRFYRARQMLELCVADVAVTAQLVGGEDGRLQPGDAFTWRIEVTNGGMAAEDVELALVLPDGVALTDASAAGLTQTGSRLSGVVCAEAAQVDEAGAAASLAVLELPMQVKPDALEGDADATRLLSGTLYADGQRVPLPRIQVCAPRISAQLMADADELEPGEETILRVLVLNEGLVGADVKMTCALPAGLELVGEDEEETTPEEATAAAPEGDDPTGPDGVAALAEAPEAPQGMTLEGNTVLLSWHMDAAKEGEAGIAASTEVFELPVRATQQSDLKEQLVGASLAYSVNGGDVQLGEAVAMRVYTPSFMGIAHEDWGAIFWACVLMMVTVSLLYAAVSAGSAKEEYCCD